jgi:5-methylcytosine-specific restriction enzyme A
MGRLKALKPRIEAMPNRLGYAQGDERALDRRRDSEQAWRAWYRTKRWADLKQAVHVRDNYTCQRTGVLCVGKHPAPNSPVANHIRPHRGDPDLFWDPENIETVSKEVHDGLIQKEEQAVPTGRWD